MIINNLISYNLIINLQLRFIEWGFSVFITSEDNIISFFRSTFLCAELLIRFTDIFVSLYNLYNFTELK